jgi:hypothetical protein
MEEARVLSLFCNPALSALLALGASTLRFSTPSDMAAPAALHLQALQHEVLLVGAGAFDTPEQLLAAGSVCHALRAAVGCPSVVQLRPLWARTIIAVADPTASLAAPPNLGLGLEHAYTEHAAAFARGRSCAWFALAHALAARNCAACGDVTRGVAWRLPAAAGAAAGGIRLLQRCCAVCTPIAHAPPADADDAGGAACVDATSGSEGDADEDDDDVDEDEEDGYDRCTIINAQLFTQPDGAHPGVLLDAYTLNDPMAALRAALAQASDGDTIRLYGEFASWDLTINNAAVRLLGEPAGAPWRSVHMSVSAGRHQALTSLAGLSALERVATTAIGFPPASISLGHNCLEIYGSVWVENVYISSGNRAADVQVQIAFPAFPAITAYNLQQNGHIMPPSLMLRHCWVTGYNGSGIGLAEGAHAALLRCCITNTRCYSVVCHTGCTLRMRGCHVLWNGLFMRAGWPTLVWPPLAAVQRIVHANLFLAHPVGFPADTPVSAVYGILHNAIEQGQPTQHVRLLD